MSNLFGGALLTPAQRQEIAIRKNLETRRDFWPHTDKAYVYKGAGDLLLRHGKFYTGRELPEEYQHLYRLDGGDGNCFRNAFFAAKESGLPYIEGVYCIGSGHYTPHAWLIDPDGHLLELTMPSDPATIARGVEHRSHQAVLPPEHWGYWGVELHIDYVEATSVAEDGYSGTLDRPVHDHLFQEAPDMDLEERRTHWPIYTYPYDPNRRTP